MKDINGRPYAKLSTCKPGDILEVDNSFTCITNGDVRKVYADNDGLYIYCTQNRHYLKGQLAKEGDSLVGLYPFQRSCNGESQSKAITEEDSSWYY